METITEMWPILDEDLLKAMINDAKIKYEQGYVISEIETWHDKPGNLFANILYIK